MLILITGITGMVGQPCAEQAIAKGHRVRGIGRDPDKVPASLRDNLEGFVTSTGIYDIPALDKAVAGVDAVICAYTFLPEVVVEGQLLLLRAAERAGVKASVINVQSMITATQTIIFHAASWNADWTLSYLGQHESYDPYIAFAAHVRISSRIKPIYMFTGVIAEWLFSGRRDPIWNRETKTMSYFGDGKKEWICTTAGDLAAYTVEAVSSPTAAQGGFVRVESFRFTPAQLVEEYEKARGGKVKAHTKCQGTLEDVESMLAKARATIHPIEHEKYIGLAYAEHNLKGTWDHEPVDNKRFPNVKPTSLRSYFEAHPDL
ncbi:hypothetical protein diail_11263 [Diaporthe ilicicola]|nr:hypothetical protein diail_11263 [Diaporthe ilicicola]